MKAKGFTAQVLLVWLLGLVVLSQASAQSADQPQAQLQLLAEGLTAPVAVVAAPDDSGRLFVVDQVGVIKVMSADGTLSDTPFLDLRDKLVELDQDYDERGLLGLAFHPDYAQNGRFFVYYSTSHLSEFQVSSDPTVADPASEKILLEVDEPQLNHNAGQILFGPDGYLYVPLGDGGGANDEEMGHVDDWYEENDGGNGQDLSTNLLGTILRIDVNTQTGDKAYGIPSDNPFVGQQGAEEIWAYGFRNPWRITFDSETGDLYVADLGQELYEEVDLVTKGGNYGWNVKEGAHCFSTQDPENPPAECPDSTPDGAALIDPVLEQSHEVGIAIIGGGIYRGSAIPSLQGKYVFGNHAVSEEDPHGNLLAATPTQDGMWSFEPISLASSPDGLLGDEERLLSFGQDGSGELYVLTKSVEGPKGDTGKVYRLVAPQ